MVGQPALLFLDEPSTGMDPGARHDLWQAIGVIRKMGTSLVVTSHSMEECEALCTRIGIMVNGEFKALGSLQHLKNKFGKGYTLEIQLGSEGDRDALDSFIRESFSTAVLKEEFNGVLTYDILMEKGVTLGKVFNLMEENRSKLKVTGYSVCQRTLEKIFLSFTKFQK